MPACLSRFRKISMAGICCLAIALVACALLPDAPSVAAQSNTRYQKFIFLLPEGFKGWVCVDFGVEGATPLPRERDAWVIRPRPGEVLHTSDTADPSTLFGEAWFEVNGKRRPLPANVSLQNGVSRSGPREPTERGCAFVGTEDEREAAADTAPGFEALAQRHIVIALEERNALEALYQSTDGGHWTHHVGWLGPPGSECNWHGVACDGVGSAARVVDLDLVDNNLTGTIPEELGQLRGLESLDLGGNHLKGTVPSSLSQLTKLTSLTLYDNGLSGRLPNPLIRKWLSGALDLRAENMLLTEVSEIDFDSNPSALLCGRQRVKLRSDGKATLFTTRCRNATPKDRVTFCEVKEGNIYQSFAMLAWLLERNGFFGLQQQYSIAVTDAGIFSTRVVRGGRTYEVVEIGGGGPFELWTIEEALQGVAFSTDWVKTTRTAKCPQWDESTIP